ncbi:MAG: tRNA preQ1(34) S-adenosylmethionine ribosyltransferase-isomerase QueA [Coxiellaceae bacterium]|nr:tRNA preQ1(34) S-adenosylmethionine ribosyltransferase-isomerase QueA [Coxiellaceae bacterium]
MPVLERPLNQLSDFDYELPSELIAQYPLADRTASRLLQVSVADEKISHGQFTDIEQLLQPGDVLVMNNTRVIPARLYGQKSTGGKIECLVERVISEQRVLAHIRSSKSPKPGSILVFADDMQARMIERQGDLFLLEFLGERTALDQLHRYGHMPLPPYIERADDDSDLERYQTVYAKQEGAVAAPTAGLHFDQALLDRLQDKGVEVTYVTLHVGAGTFQPVRVDNLDDHVMHSEYLEVDQGTCDVVNKARAENRRIVAVGTTSVRCLESAYSDGELKPFQGDTQLFIRPGYQFKCVDALITNFHLPQSTLLMLVAAMTGYDFMLKAYEEAVKSNYRFFSYGDAMFINQCG